MKQNSILHLPRPSAQIYSELRQRYPTTSTQVVQVADFVTRNECKLHYEPQARCAPLLPQKLRLRPDRKSPMIILESSTQHEDKILDSFFVMILFISASSKPAL